MEGTLFPFSYWEFLQKMEWSACEKMSPQKLPTAKKLQKCQDIIFSRQWHRYEETNCHRSCTEWAVHESSYDSEVPHSRSERCLWEVQFHDYGPLLYIPFSYQFPYFHPASMAFSLSVQHSPPLFCFNIYSSAFQTTLFWGFIHYYFHKISCSECFGTDVKSWQRSKRICVFWAV